jgi:hypothetical protein
MIDSALQLEALVQRWQVAQLAVLLRQWPAALQLTALLRWSAAHCSPGQRCVAMWKNKIFVLFFFFLLESFMREKEREKERRAREL